MKKIGLLLVTLLLSALSFAACGRTESDDKVILGDNYGGNENFYVVAEQSRKELDILDVKYQDGVLLFTARNYLTGEVCISTYNINTGVRTENPTVKVASAQTYKSGFSQDGAIYTFDYVSNALTFYDANIRETQKTNFVNINVDELYVSHEYAFCISGDTLVRVNLKNNAAEELYRFDRLNAASIGFVGAAGDELLITGHDENLEHCLIVCDMKSGNCAYVGRYDGKLLFRDDIAALDYCNGATLSVYDYDRPDILSTLCLEESGERLIGAGKGKICTSLISGDAPEMVQTLRIYSLELGALAALCEFEYDIAQLESEIDDVFIVDDDFALFEVKVDKTSRIVLWKYSDSAAESADHKLLIVGTGDDTVEKQNEELISGISGKYGINIITGDDAVRYYPDYVAVPENGADATSKALADVQKTLEKFPEGFFAELIEKGSHDSLNIVLCKKMFPSHIGGLSSASGYFVELEGQYILLSISSGDIENSLSHEIMHAAEAAMHLYSHTEFGEWNGFNPEGFEYTNSYVDENGHEYDFETLKENTPYDFESITDPDNIAFFDYYSKTFEKEDRARIFEMLMANELSPYFESKILKSKAAYLCRRLSSFFECAAKSSDVYWERILK